MIKYETDPIKIRNAYSQRIREEVSLDHLSTFEQKIAIEMVQSSGDLSIIESLRFSETAIDTALELLDEDYDLLCDTETVICDLNEKYLKHEPLCLINKANVISQAKSNKQTRSMIAVDLWKPYLSDSIVLVGSEATALSRLLEILESLKKENKDNKPALIIATPVGFVGAKEIKKYLWKHHEELETPCITLLGNRGGSNLTSTIMNCLFKIKKSIGNE